MQSAKSAPLTIGTSAAPEPINESEEKDEQEEARVRFDE